MEQSGKTHVINGITIKSRKKTSGKWFETQDSISYWDDFTHQKLVWTPVNSEYRFAVLPENMYFNNSLFMIVGSRLEYLCGILNSKLYIAYFNIILSGGSYTYGSRDFFESIPVCNFSNSLSSKLETLVREIIINPSDEESKALQEKIDNVVYEIYGLDESEIAYLSNY